MNTYTVTSPHQDAVTVQAEDFTTDAGLVVFRDDIGRAIEAFAVTDGLRIICAYGDDDTPEWVARRRLMKATSAANVAAMEARALELEGS